MSRRFAATTLNRLIGVVILLAIVIAIFALARLDVTGRKGSGLSDEFVYDIKDLAKIDPNLILYEEATAPIRTGFTAARGIAVCPQRYIYVAGLASAPVAEVPPPQGRGLIATASRGRIRRFSQTGQLLAETEFNDMPRCLAISEDGKIYAGMKDHVEVYDAQGKRLANWQSLGDNAVLTSIAVSQNDVFVADAGNRVVLHYDTSGKLINRIGQKDPQRDIPGFVIPSPYFDLAVASDGLLRVADPGRHRIEAYTFDGDLEFWWGEFSWGLEGFCGCCNPVNFTLLQDDSFVTCEKGLVRVKICDPKGVFVGVVAGPEQLFEAGASRVSEFGAGPQAGGFDVAVDSRGRIFVLDTIENTVRIFTRKGAGR